MVYFILFMQSIVFVSFITSAELYARISYKDKNKLFTESDQNPFSYDKMCICVIYFRYILLPGFRPPPNRLVVLRSG